MSDDEGVMSFQGYIDTTPAEVTPVGRAKGLWALGGSRWASRRSAGSMPYLEVGTNPV